MFSAINRCVVMGTGSGINGNRTCCYVAFPYGLYARMKSQCVGYLMVMETREFRVQIAIVSEFRYNCRWDALLDIINSSDF